MFKWVRCYSSFFGGWLIVGTFVFESCARLLNLLLSNLRLSAHVSLLVELGLDRYKIVAQAVIGEQRGEGVK
jgi:hypothetical protein